MAKASDKSSFTVAKNYDVAKNSLDVKILCL